MKDQLDAVAKEYAIVSSDSLATDVNVRKLPAVITVSWIVREVAHVMQAILEASVPARSVPRAVLKWVA